MRNIKVIKRVVLILILSLATTSVWSQDCITAHQYESGDPLNMSSLKNPKDVCPIGGEGCDPSNAVCVDLLPLDGGIDYAWIYYYSGGSGCSGGSFNACIKSFLPLGEATFFLVSLLGAYGARLYRKRRVATKI